MAIYDRDIREPLFAWVEAQYGKIRVIEEKTISGTRADVLLVLPDRLTGMEIKSDADTYARLPRQARDYDRYFDENVLVAGSTHRQAAGHVPDWWGIITVSDGGNETPLFQKEREPKPSPLTEQKLKLSLLWRPELVHILTKNGLPRYERKSKKFVIERIATLVPAETLATQISDELFERDYTTIGAEIEAYRRANRRR